MHECNAFFKKFDRDGSGELEKPEFHKAWEFLGLSATRDEVDQAFKGVDVDGSGIISIVEFMQAIKDSRSAELSLGLLVEKMDGHLEGMEGFFADYKNKLTESKREAQEALANSEERFKKFQQTACRRRLMKKQMEEKIRELGGKLISAVGEQEETNDKDAELYKTARDTFNAFDRDGSAEMA